MTETTHLWLFFVLVFGVVLLPGLDMAYVLASALVGGRRAGMAATAGIVAGGVVHVTMGALGIMAVLRLFPAAFNAVLANSAFGAPDGFPTVVECSGSGIWRVCLYTRPGGCTPNAAAAPFEHQAILLRQDM